MKVKYATEIFEDYGPTYLKNVDWSTPDERRSVAASLVEGVYIRERDRQKKRTGGKELGPIWWEFFHFQRIQDLKDVYDGSIFGTVFEYNHPHNPNQNSDKTPKTRPPKYVIALRGTILKWRTILQDGYCDVKYILNSTKNNTRYQTSLQAVQDIIDKVGPENVWLTGHSLGAAIALQVGKTLAIEGNYIETYLFNPPYFSLPIEKLANRKLKTGIRVVKSFLTVGAVALHATFKDTSNTQLYDAFTNLRPWIPYLFVNQNDPISCEYIGYFEHQKKMESWGLGFIQKIAAPNSIRGLMLRGAFGTECEAFHRIPSACIVKNLNPMEDVLGLTHGIEQWWARHTKWHTKRYDFDDTSCN